MHKSQRRNRKDTWGSQIRSVMIFSLNNEKKTTNGVAGRNNHRTIQYNSIDQLRAVAFLVNHSDNELFQALESGTSNLA